MPEKSALTSIHPAGEATAQALTASEPAALDTFAGKVFIRWDPDANVTGFGPAAYFIEFLKTNGLWERWVEDCPLHYTSPNAPPKQDILGTVMLSVLAGHKRYAHITTVRSDNVLPGDISWGTERMMQQAEERELPYVFKLKKTSKVNRHIEKLWGRRDWVAAGAGWQGLSSELQLTGWSRPRRVVILRRQLRETVAISEEERRTGQRVFSGMAELRRGQDLYEYSVLVTSLDDEVLSMAQLYRDRAEAENIFDEGSVK